MRACSTPQFALMCYLCVRIILWVRITNVGVEAVNDIRKKCSSEFSKTVNGWSTCNTLETYLDSSILFPFFWHALCVIRRVINLHNTTKTDCRSLLPFNNGNLKGAINCNSHYCSHLAVSCLIKVVRWKHQTIHPVRWDEVLGRGRIELNGIRARWLISWNERDNKQRL